MKNNLKTFDVQFVEIAANFKKAFNFISDPANLPKWTAAFKEADENTALMVTPAGELKISLKTIATASGTIDWHMTMPDGSVGNAFSRLTELPNGHVVYSFILLAPPVPVEQIEGTLEMQKKLLAEELINLTNILENN
jgi:hypothetical protein